LRCCFDFKGVRSVQAGFVCLVLPVASCLSPLLFPSVANFELLFRVMEGGTPVEVAGEPVFFEQQVFDAIAGKVGSHASTLTAFDDGELLAAWYSYTGPHELDGSAIFTARRLAGSETWDTPILHIDRPEGDGNPVLYSEGDHVWLFAAVVPFGWSTARIEMQQSWDRGRTWSSATVVSGMLGANVRFPPVRTAAGQLLLPAYSDLTQQSLFFSSDDGLNWSLTSTVSTNSPHMSIQPSVVRLSNDRLLAATRNVEGGWLWVMASDDHGRSWSEPQDSGFPNPDSAAALSRLASGNLVLVFNDSMSERRPLSIALSGDEGLTWPHQRILVDGEASYSYPAVVQGPDGMIHILYSLDRLRIAHMAINESWIVGDSGGE